jgi:hypothetical protein
MAKAKTYYRVQEHVGGWHILSEGQTKHEADERAQKALQDEHGGLWEGQYMNTQLVTRAQLLRKFRFTEESLAEYEYNKTRKPDDVLDGTFKDVRGFVAEELRATIHQNSDNARPLALIEMLESFTTWEQLETWRDLPPQCVAYVVNHCLPADL